MSSNFKYFQMENATLPSSTPIHLATWKTVLPNITSIRKLNWNFAFFWFFQYYRAAKFLLHKKKIIAMCGATLPNIISIHFLTLNVKNCLKIPKICRCNVAKFYWHGIANTGIFIIFRTLVFIQCCNVVKFLQYCRNLATWIVFRKFSLYLATLFFRIFLRN